MNALERLLNEVKSGQFTPKPLRIPTTPNPALSAAIATLAAAEQALCTPAVIGELQGQVPDTFADWPLDTRCDWVAERLGTCPTPDPVLALSHARWQAILWGKYHPDDVGRPAKAVNHHPSNTRIAAKNVTQ